MAEIILILNKKIYKKKDLNWGQIPPLIILNYDSKRTTYIIIASSH
jgi:hypothetical protein